MILNFFSIHLSLSLTCSQIRLISLVDDCHWERLHCKNWKENTPLFNSCSLRSLDAYKTFFFSTHFSLTLKHTESGIDWKNLTKLVHSDIYTGYAHARDCNTLWMNIVWHYGACAAHSVSICFVCQFPTVHTEHTAPVHCICHILNADDTCREIINNNNYYY